MDLWSLIFGGGTANKWSDPLRFRGCLEGDGGGSGGGQTGGYSADYVRDLRDENATWRKKLRTAEEDNDKLKKQFDEATAKTKDLEGQQNTFLGEVRESLGLDAQADAKAVIAKVKDISAGINAITGKAQEALRKAAFMAAATKHGIDPKVADDAFKLADLSKVKVDLESLSVYPVGENGKQLNDKDGKPVAGLGGIVEALVKEKPYLAGKGGSTSVGSASNPGTGGPVDEAEEAKKIAEERNKGPQPGAGGYNPWETK